MLVDIDEDKFYNYVETSVGYVHLEAAVGSRQVPRSSPLKVYNYTGTRA